MGSPMFDVFFLDGTLFGMVLKGNERESHLFWGVPAKQSHPFDTPKQTITPKREARVPHTSDSRSRTAGLLKNETGSETCAFVHLEYGPSWY